MANKISKDDFFVVSGNTYKIFGESSSFFYNLYLKIFIEKKYFFFGKCLCVHSTWEKKSTKTYLLCLILIKIKKNEQKTDIMTSNKDHSLLSVFFIHYDAG